MELANQGKIGTLIVKDHSRLGRNRLIVGQLLEEGFDELGIRYIAIMDNIDTANGLSDLVPMQDLFNEWHAKNTSQKVRNVFKNKGMSGVPLTTTHLSDMKKIQTLKTNGLLMKMRQKQSKEYLIYVLKVTDRRKLRKN